MKKGIIATLILTLCMSGYALAEKNVFYGRNDHGVGGTIRVEVVMEGNVIQSIKTLEQKETRGLGTNAIMQLTKEMVRSNSPEVDAVSGATLTSYAFAGAVRQAVEEASGFDPVVGVELGENEFLGISNNGLGGRLMVKVTVQEGKIMAVDVVEAHETEEIGMAALNRQIAQIIENNNAQADAITGATITCDALSEAVANALAASENK